MSTSPTNNQSTNPTPETPITHVNLGKLKIRLTRIFQTITALAIALIIGGIVSLSLGSSLAIALPLLVIGLALLILTCFFLGSRLRKTPLPIPAPSSPPIKPKPTGVTPGGTPAPTTPPSKSPVVTPPPTPVETTPPVSPIVPVPVPEIQIPRFSNLKPQYIANLLKNRFVITGTHPAGRMNKNTEYVTTQSKNTNLNVCFLKGHPLDDPFLKKTNSAILILTNAGREKHLLLGRSLALSAHIEKVCWNDITKPESTSFPPESVIAGAWVNKTTDIPPASHLICVNPPSIVLTRNVQRRAINFGDFNYEREFRAAVGMYRTIFGICKENNITSIQLELLGLNNIGPDQEEYSAWHSECCLALLEAIRLEEETGGNSLTHITVNSRAELPLLSILQKAYNN
ncbi:hypothetical protein C834K_0350 [Chlamydia poikilotherma]|uniref:Macro domain-containing protein n=1 Tax=Chlamydia poikilotherma TaxID=1967783 RepID=A0A3B0PNS4_9CHLA|nr:hypothetical protein [Chlamydia poikilotherma]SYX08813.1 hypothetical protein C834K_0350 [Chlamydia poikilotherma]